ncbi:hypothetical protein FG05_35134 [Fusarium graminearum]|nr:hypothetical protein FG05_35134 [Fusarium graminearum]
MAGRRGAKSVKGAEQANELQEEEKKHPR